MKKIVLIIFLFLFISPVLAFEDDFFDIDLDAIDNRYPTKYVSDEQFDKTIEQIKGQKREPTKFTKWLFGIKDAPQADQKQNQSPTVSAPSEFDIIRDTMSSNNLVSLYTPIYDDFNHIIPIGHYKVQYKVSKNGLGYILLKESGKIMGCFRASKYKDHNTKNNAIIYSSLTYENNLNYVRIIISDFSDTYSALGRVVK